MPSCISEQEDGGFTASALQYEPRPPFLFRRCALTIVLATTPTSFIDVFIGHKHEQLATQV